MEEKTKLHKLRIIPARFRILAQLMADMEMTAQEREILAHGFIRHVEVTAETNLWEILFWTPVNIDEELLQRSSAFIEKQHS